MNNKAVETAAVVSGEQTKPEEKLPTTFEGKWKDMESKGFEIYKVPIDAVQKRTDELFKKFPKFETDILKALNVWPIFQQKGYKQQ